MRTKNFKAKNKFDGVNLLNKYKHNTNKKTNQNNQLVFFIYINFLF